MRIRISGFLILFALLNASPVLAATFTVGSGAGCTHATIQAAIDAANSVSNPGADEIRLSGGPYANQSLSMHVAANRGAISLIGGYATCTSPTPANGARTIISGPGPLPGNPVLRISNTADATLRNLEIINGDGSGLVVETDNSGNAVSLVTLIDTHVTDNRGPEGGGINLANYNASSPQSRLRLVLLVSSQVYENTGLVRGGGIACRNATLEVRDTSEIRLNAGGSSGFAGNHDGGGIFIDNCHVELSNASAEALFRNFTYPPGRGGGFFATGPQTTVDIYSQVQGTNVYIIENRASNGGGIAIANGAQVRMYGSSGLHQNQADESGAAIWMAPGETSGVDTRLLMQSEPDANAPEDAVGCFAGGTCMLILDNLSRNTDNSSSPGAILNIAMGNAGSAHAEFRGVRMSLNDGYNLFAQEPSDSRVRIEGSLIDGNTVRGGFGAFTAASVDNALVLTASTLANNAFVVAGTPVFGTPVTCDPNNDEIGTHLRRSIIWQPGHGLLFTLFDPPQANCFTDLIANDFGWLGTAADRVMADPAFENAAAFNFQLSSASPALDFALPDIAEVTVDGGPRVIDDPAVPNVFGAQDLGAYERTYSPIVSASAIGNGGAVGPSTQSVPYGASVQIFVQPLAGWHAITPLGGDCPTGTFQGTVYTADAITAPCSILVDFIRDTTITLSSTDETSVFGQSVQFLATIAGSMPTGSITFRDGPSVLATVPLSGPSASFTTTALTVGTHAITASYAGDADNTPSTSPTLTQTVERSGSTVLVPTPTAIRLGQSATFTAIVTATSPGAGTPTGTIAISAGSAGSCTITLPAASCSFIPVDVAGSVGFTANYSGDSNFTPGSASGNLQVTPQYVSGSVSGLSAGPLSLRLTVTNEPDQTTSVAAGGSSFAFTTPVPVGAQYTVTVQTNPPGLSCVVANGSGTMPADDVGNVSVSCSSAPSANLTLNMGDGTGYARYGQTLVYTVDVSNSGNAGASNVAVSVNASPGLNLAASTWTCTPIGEAASCGTGGSGALTDIANLPAGASVIYTVSVPVLANTPEPNVRFEVRVNDVERIQSDTDVLVIQRDGFDG